MSLLFNMLSRLVITFLPRSKHLLISWLKSPSAVILEPRKIKSATVSTVSPSICQEVMGPDAMILVFWMLSFKATFSLSSFTFIKRLFSSSSLCAKVQCWKEQYCIGTWNVRSMNQDKLEVVKRREAQRGFWWEEKWGKGRSQQPAEVPNAHPFSTPVLPYHAIYFPVPLLGE